MRFVAALLFVSSCYQQHAVSAFSTGQQQQQQLGTTSFVVTNQRRSNAVSTRKQSFTATSRRTTTTLLSMSALDRLSDDCVSAIRTAHSIGNDIGLTVLRNEVLFAGIIGTPERASLTLEKYTDITYDAVKASAIAQIEKSPTVELIEGGTGSTAALPFSAASKIVLERALLIADELQSPQSSVRSEHVLLALLGYNGGKPIESAPALTVLGAVPNLKGIDGKGTFSCFKFCEQLVQDLESQPNEDLKSSSREEVLIGGSGLGLGTATLSAVGVDLTQMALDGQLDNVYGRDQEIRTALRTLGRRRKNNPCLIGGMLLSKIVVE